MLASLCSELARWQVITYLQSSFFPINRASGNSGSSGGISGHWRYTDILRWYRRGHVVPIAVLWWPSTPAFCKCCKQSRHNRRFWLARCDISDNAWPLRRWAFSRLPRGRACPWFAFLCCAWSPDRSFRRARPVAGNCLLVIHWVVGVLKGFVCHFPV